MIARAKAMGRRLLIKARFCVDEFTERLRTPPPTLPLERVQRRLELLLIALYGHPIPIVPAEQRPSTAFSRLHRWAHRRSFDQFIPEINSTSIQLPAELPIRQGESLAIARYQLFSIQQAERLIRGTILHAPVGDELALDLFLVREALSVDARITHAHARLVDPLVRERRLALSRRPRLDSLKGVERRVEQFVQQALVASPAVEMADLDAAASAAWAAETAAAINPDGSRYRRIRPIAFWGAISSQRSTLIELADEDIPRSERRLYSSIQLMTGPLGFLDMETRDERAARSGKGELDADPDDPEAYAKPGAGNRNAGVTGPYPNDQPKTKSSEQNPTRHIASREPTRIERNEAPGRSAVTSRYDEWNAETSKYIKNGVTVRELEAAPDDSVRTEEFANGHRVLVRQVRRQFERLRSRRTLLRRQHTGADLDLAACVEALVDQRRGASPNERVYIDVRPARRSAALTLLVDTSGSTQRLINDVDRVIDVEKTALFLAAEALDALGDPFGIFAFAGQSAADVRITPVKRFNEPFGPLVRGRISALASGGFTRLGAAIRHAARSLSDQSAAHRLLLILSDGRPNDVDVYQGPYGVEDSRRAVLEARGDGIIPFCIAVDSESSEWLPRIFGRDGHVVVRNPNQLPTALLRVVTATLRRR